jgi:large subunit ribosomal protein L18
MDKLRKQNKRKLRVRTKIKGISNRPRLSVYRSNKNIYAQIVDDTKGTTLASASSLKLKETGAKAAEKVGSNIAKSATKKGTKTVVFDRGQYKYHGQIKALAESARKNGLEF